MSVMGFDEFKKQREKEKAASSTTAAATPYSSGSAGGKTGQPGVLSFEQFQQTLNVRPLVDRSALNLQNDQKKYQDLIAAQQGREAAIRAANAKNIGAKTEQAKLTLDSAQKTAAQASANVQSMENLNPWLARGDNPTNERERMIYEQYKKASEEYEAAKSELNKVENDYYSVTGNRVEYEQPEQTSSGSKAKQIMDRVLGIDRSKVTGEKTQWGKLLAGGYVKGMYQWANNFWQSADFILGEPAQMAHDLGVTMVNSVIDAMNIIPGVNIKEVEYGDNAITKLRKISDAEVAQQQQMFEANANSSAAAQVVDKMGTSAVAAVPFALEALFLAPTKAAEATIGGTTKGLRYASSLANATGGEAVGLMTKEGMDKMLRNPQFWSSYLQTAGPSYENAKAEGMEDGQAAVYGLVNGFVNAAIEIGGADEALGGIQNPTQEWIDSLVEEGVEEVTQGIAERGLKAPMTGAPLTPFTVNDLRTKSGSELVQQMLNDDRAVLNPFTAAEEFTGGATVGAFLGGGQRIIQNSVNRAAQQVAVQQYVKQEKTVDKKLETALTTEQKTENRAAVMETIVEREAARTGTELADKDIVALAGIYDAEQQQGTKGADFARAALEAYQMGKSGQYNAEEARAQSKSGAKLSVEQFTRAYNAGAAAVSTDVQAADTKTEKGKEAVLASLASLGEHAEAAAGVVEDGQDLNAYSYAMNLASGYAANGGSVAELVQQAKDGEISGSGLEQLTEEQVKVAQEIGREMQTERAEKVKELAAKRAEIGRQAEAILAAEIPELGEINEGLQSVGDYIKQTQAELDAVRAEMDAMLEADPDAESSEAYQQAEKRAAELEENIKNTEQIRKDLQAARKEARGKAQRKKGTVSYDGATIDGKKYNGVDQSKLNKQQQRVVKMVESLADIINVDYVLYEGPAGQGGAYPGNGVIYLNINSGMGVRSFAKQITAASLSHELTHFAQDYAPEEYEELRQYIVEQVMQKSPAQFDKMVRQQMRWEPDLSYDEAVNELVANGCMEMLRDTKAVQQVVRDHLNLAERFAQRLEEIGQQIKDAFAEVDAKDDAAIYHVARELQDAHAEIQERWDRAIAAATENYNAEKTVQRANGITVDMPARVTANLKFDDAGTQTISENMTEEERYNLLKDKKITVYPYDASRFEQLRKELNGEDLDKLNRLLQGEHFTKKTAFNLLKKIGESFSTFKDYSNKDISVTFEYSKSSLKHSNNKQEIGEALAFAKMLTVFDEVIDSAIGIEAHGKRYEYEKRNKSSFERMYVLFGAYKDGKDIVPVRAEVKIYSDKTSPKLDVVVTMSKINEADVIQDIDLNEYAENSSRQSASEYMVADLLRNVNPEDTGMLKYIPDGFLDEQRMDGKRRGLENTEEYKANKEKRKAQKSKKQTWDEMSPEEQRAEINATMTMQQAKAMVEKAFTAAGIKEWYDGKYRNGDQWLKAEGASDVADIIENEYELQRKYVNSNPHLVDYDFTIEDVLDAYLAGTLTGKTKAARQRVDVSQSRGYKDSRFYAPSFGKADAETWAKANERATKANESEVLAARKNILLAAHEGNIEQALGITASELNKKLRSWSRYSSSARAVSMQINKGVAPENQWTGIQNSAILSGMSVSDEDIQSMVKDVTGESSEYQRRYIGNAMLALDTHIDWSWLSFDFKRGNADPNRRSVRGFYNDGDRNIVIGGSSYQNTVSHEMGHALDFQWQRDLFGENRANHPLSQNSWIDSLIADDEGRLFYHNFRSFIDDLMDVSSNYSNYTMEPTEIFARFVAKFVEWTQETAGAYVFKESGFYDDKFTGRQYVEFAKLLQEKSAWDAKHATDNQTQFQRWDDTTDDTALERAGRDMAYARLQSENAILNKTLAEIKKLSKTQGKTIEALQKKLQITKTPETRRSDAKKLARRLIQEHGSQIDTDSVADQLKAMGDYLLQTETDKIDENTVKDMARGIARDILDNATDLFGAEDENYSRIAADIRGKKLSIDEAFLGDLDRDGGYDAFRKSLFGKLTLAKRAQNSREVREGYRSVDQFYNDMQGEYGKGFFPDVTNEGEQIEILAQMLDASGPMQVNPYEQYMGEVTEELANNIVMEAMSGVLRETEPTLADKQKARTKELQERIQQLKAENKLADKEASRLYRTIYDLSLQLDKAESQYTSLQLGAADRIAQVRAEGRARAAEIKAAEREKAAQNIKELREHYQQMRKQATEQRSNTATRKKIRKLINDLNNRLAHPTEFKHVPKELTQATIDMLELIDDPKAARTEKGALNAAARVADIRQVYESYKNNPEYPGVYDETISDMLDNLAQTIRGKTLRDMNELQLNAVYRALQSMTHVVNNAVKVRIGNEERNAYELAKQMTQETREVPKAQRGWIREHGIPAHLRADVAFDRFGGFKKNSTWQQAARLLNDGQLRQTQLKMELSLPFAELFNNQKALADYTGMNALGKVQESKLVDIGLRDENGKAIPVTHDFMVALYMDLLNEENRRHFIRGGKTVPDYQEFYDGKGGYGMGSRRAMGISAELGELYHELSEAKKAQYGDWAAEIQDRIDALEAEGEQFADDVKERIEKSLTDYDRQWIKAIRQLMDVDSKRELNRTTMDVYGIEKANTPNYFPIFTDKDFIQSPMETVTRDASLENAGFMKERVKSGNPTRAVGSVWAVTQQIDRVAQYAGLMPAIRNFNKIYGKTQSGYSDSLKKALNETFGKSGTDYVENLIADLTGSRQGAHDELGLDKLLANLRGNLARSSLTLNPRVALAQAASFPTAAAELGYKPIMKALAKGGKNGMPISRADAELIAKWSPLLWYRMQGYSMPELGDIRSSSKLADRVWRKARFLTGWIQAVDGATVGRLWYAAEYWVQDNKPNLEKGSDAYYEAVAEKFNAVVEKTQPNYTPMQRAAILRNPNALVKTFTMFMTQRLQNFNILYDAAGRYQKARADLANNRNGVTKADVAEARTDMARAISSQIAQTAMFVGLKVFVDFLLHSVKKYRDKETGDITEESVGLAVLDACMDTLMGNVLGGSEIYSIIKAATGQSKWYGLSVSGVDSLNDMVEAAVNLANAKVDWDDEKSRKSFYSKAMKLGTSFAQALGIPLNNGVKIGQAFYQHAEDAANGQLLSYESGYERTKAQNTEKLIRALESGDEDAIAAAEEPFDSEKDAFSAVKSEIGDRYKEDKLTEKQATDLLAKIGVEGDDAYWTLRGWEGEDKYTEVKEAVLAGDSKSFDAEMKQLTEHGVDEKTVTSSVKSFIKKIYLGEELGEKEAEIVGDRTLSAAEARKMLAAYAGMDADDAIKTVESWDFKKEHGFYYDDRKEAYFDGEISKKELRSILTGYGGKSAEDADDIIKAYDFEKEHGWAWSSRKELYQKGKVSRNEMYRLLQSYGGMTAEKADAQLQVWDWSKNVPGAENITLSAIEKYNTNCVPANVSKETFVKAWSAYNNTDPDYDEKGDAVKYSLTKKVMPQIDALPLTPEQKTAVALCFWSAKTVKKYKLW